MKYSTQEIINYFIWEAENIIKELKKQDNSEEYNASCLQFIAGIADHCHKLATQNA